MNDHVHQVEERPSDVIDREHYPYPAPRATLPRYWRVAVLAVGLALALALLALTLAPVRLAGSSAPTVAQRGSGPGELVYVLLLPDGTQQLACDARYGPVNPNDNSRIFEFDACVAIFRDGFE